LNQCEYAFFSESVRARERRFQGHRAIENSSNAGIVSDRNADHRQAVSPDDLEVHGIGRVIDVPLVPSRDCNLHAVR
jgi:hypothetical protein